MTRPVAIAAMLVLGLSVPLLAGPGVEVDGVFVRSGTFTEVTQVKVNQPIQLVVRVRDVSDVPQGVAGGKVNVAWNEAVLQLQDVIDGNAGDVSDVRPLFNQNTWTAFYSGWRVDPEDPNVYADPTDPNNPILVEMGAGQSVPAKLTLDQAEAFFTLTFLPIAPGSASVKLSGQEFGVIPVDPTNPPTGPVAHSAVNPTLTVIADTTIDPNQPSGPDQIPPAPMCFGPALAVGVLMIGGCSGILRGRHGRRSFR